MIGIISLYGKVFKYKEGYRSQFAKVENIAIIDNKKWLDSKAEEEQKYIKHFHNICEQIKVAYKIELSPYSEIEKFDGRIS